MGSCRSCLRPRREPSPLQATERLTIVHVRALRVVLRVALHIKDETNRQAIDESLKDVVSAMTMKNVYFIDESDMLPEKASDLIRLYNEVRDAYPDHMKFAIELVESVKE